MDLEAEMNRFELMLGEQKKMYTVLELPLAVPVKQVTVAVDAFSTCCLGLPPY
jgi:hypothetical protein